ncbi:MAG: hypothetical protein FK731_15615 [Asgard group archaeon]|nr:hypothetical protein [Asgard group archaeon]
MVENEANNGLVSNETNVSVETESVQEPTVSQPAEKVLRQSEVNEIAKHAKYLGRQAGRQEALSEFQSQMQGAVTQQKSQPDVVASNGSINQDNIRKMIAEEAQKLVLQAQQEQLQAQAQQIVNNFGQKIESGRKKYPDFDDKVGALNIAAAPEIVPWLNSLDNTEDVLYELAQNPTKFLNLLDIVNKASRHPHLASAEFNKLSESIKKNQAAANQAKVAEPLSQINPSVTSTDNGELSVSDLRRQPYLKV